MSIWSWRVNSAPTAMTCGNGDGFTWPLKRYGGVVNHLTDGILKNERQNGANTDLAERRNQAYQLFARNPSTLHIYDGWNMAGRLHGHFYSGNLTFEQLDRNIEGCLLLADNLERVLVTMLPGQVG